MTDFDAHTVPLDSNQLIEASAGTGKTYTITNFCLRLLLGSNAPQLPIDKILILTFTIAATAELRERIAGRINKARQTFRTGEGDDFLMHLYQASDDRERDLKLLTAASQLMDDASIFTIHGFCARVLGERAFDAGMLFNQELNAERNDLLQQAAEDHFRNHVLTLPPQLRQVALDMWNHPDRIVQDLNAYLFRNIDEFHPEGIESFSPSELLKKAEEVKTGWLDEGLSDFIKGSDLDGRNLPKKLVADMDEFCRQPDIDLLNRLWQIYSEETLKKAHKKGTYPDHPVLVLLDEVATSIIRLKAFFWYQARENILALIKSNKETWNRHTLDDLLTLTAEAVTRPGSQLGDQLATRWPIALIDEFQDTDSTQYDIFRTIYPPDHTGHSLIMIGDPKQAIYNFRGADVFTYFNARQEVEGQHTLITNWRSSPAYLDAANTLFSAESVFGSEDIMTYKPVVAPELHQNMAMTIDKESVKPFQVFCCEEPDDFLNADPARYSTMEYAAEQAANLIRGNTTAALDGEPVTSGRIAFLVRNRRDAQIAKSALAKRGIDSAYLTQDSIFAEDTAIDVHTILEAVLEPGNDRKLRAALATRLMQVDIPELDQLNRDPALQQATWQSFNDYLGIWQKQGIASMLGRLTAEQRLGSKWLHQPEGERQLANVRHLAELLQEQSAVTSGRHHLVKWLARKVSDADGAVSESEQLRLESDRDLVQIVTMHSAKGLQYDIVFIPQPVPSAMPQRGFRTALFHELRQGKHITSLDLCQDGAMIAASSQESMDEEIRLLYVALTRARYRCYLGIPKSKGLGGSALARLLNLHSVKKDTYLLGTVRESLPEHLFEVVDGNHPGCTVGTDTKGHKDLLPPPALPRIQTDWRVHSYTGIVNRLKRIDDADHIAGYSDDDQGDNVTLTQAKSRFSLIRGPRIGVALHSLMEEISFQDHQNHQIEIEKFMRRVDLEENWKPVLEDWLQDILATPLSDHSLSDIESVNRLDEMEFHFSVDADQSLIDRLIGTGLLSSIGTPAFRLKGMMTGFIDLLYRHEDKYYVLDYKSNYLGSAADDYRRSELESAMSHHEYHLQYLIYTVAVHRMLRLRLENYDYEKHFGGVRYLFLRGMDGHSDKGVFSARPDLALVEELDGLLGGTR